MAICRAKGVPLFLSHFKTLSVGPVPTDWARPCLGFYYISVLFLFNLAKISFNLKIPKRDLKQTAYIYRLKCAKRLLSFFHIKNKKLEYVILQFSIIYLTVSNYSKIPKNKRTCSACMAKKSRFLCKTIIPILMVKTLDFNCVRNFWQKVIVFLFPLNYICLDCH